MEARKTLPAAVELSMVLKRLVPNKAIISLSKEEAQEARSVSVNKDLAAILWVSEVIKHAISYC